MKRISLALALMLVSSMYGLAQVTTNSGSGLAASYPDLATAITALNGATISSPVVITLAGSETAPAGGYIITAQGTAANTIVIQGGSNTITASGALTAGSLSDAIFKLTGADYVTIEGFTLVENGANTTTTAGSNNMTEWGIALLYATTTNGAQNCTIQNNRITLNRTYQNTFGIYSNSTHSATIPTTSASATTTAGGNSGLKIYGNNISSVNNGIVVVGPTGAADYNDGVDIGGTSASTGNTLTDFGTTGTFSAYVNVATTAVSGILVRNVKSVNVSYNSITSSSGAAGVVAGTLRGIYAPSASNTPTGTFSSNFNNNTIALTSHVVGGVINGISIEASTSTITSSLNINNNNFTALNHTIAAATAAITGILHTGSATTGPLGNSISNNTFTNLTANTTGSYTFISNNWTRPANGASSVINNSIVTGFSKTGAGGTVQFYLSNSTSPPTASEINSGNNFSNVTVTGATTIAGWQSSDGPTSSPFGPSKIVSSNTFTNITGGSNTVTVLSVGYSNTAANNTVSNNMVNTVSGSGSVIGITSAQGAHLFTGNTVWGLSSSGASAVNGISITGGSTQTIARSKIYDLSGSNAASTVNGILVTAGTTVNIVNNMIGDLRTPAANAANPLIGINTSGTTTTNIRYNTVWLNATSSGALFGSTAILATTAPTTELRNNIFVNNSTANGAGLITAYRRSSTTLTTYASASNNNLFYSGTPGANNLIFFDGTNSDQTIVAFKTRVAIRDGGSVTENPNFLSTSGASANFLHIDPAIATQVESAGTPIAGITDDFDGDGRNATTPDIGADEFGGIAADFSTPTISYTPFSNLACYTNATLSPVTITDASGVNLTAGSRPRLYFKKTTNANAFNDNTNATDGWKYVEASGTGGSPFSFTTDYSLLFGGGGIVSGDTLQYFVVAQDLVATPNIGINNGIFAAAPTSVALTAAAFPITGTINRVAYITSLSGTVTIGAAGTYPTLTGTGGLFEAINANGISANVTANILDASITEPGTIALNAISYTGCVSGNTYTLLIKPGTGVTSTLTGTVASGAVIKLNGADYVTIDGSNSGGTDKSLTIQNNTTTTSGNAVLWMAAPASGNGATYNTVKNCIIEGNAATTTFMGIYVGGTSSISLTSAGAERNNNNTFTHNLFRKTQNGLVLFGAATGTPDQNNVISNNNFGTTVTGEGFQLEGIHADRQENLLVVSNDVQNVRGTSGTNMYGIRLIDFKTGSCIKNIVHNVAYTGTSTTKNYGIAIQNPTYNTSGNASASLIANNFIYAINSSGTSSVWNATGLLANQGYADRYYHNTVDMGGQLNNSSSGLSAAFANGDGNHTGVATNIDVRNNIFNLTGSSLGGNVWAYHTLSTNFTGAIQNNNLLRSAGTGATNNTGRVNSISYTTLAAWQTATGVDANSVSTAPVFVSATDLHILNGSNVLIDNLGTPVSGVPDDIDGETRSLTTPDLGADEFSSPPCVTAVGGTAAGNAYGCLNYTGNITATGFSTGVGTTYQWLSASSPTGPWTPIGGATTPSLFNISPAITTTTYYKLAVACATNTSVDSSTVATITIVNKPTVPVTPAGPITICAASSQTFDASGTNAATPAFTWLRNNVAISGATSATYATNVAASYRVRVVDGVTGCFDTSAAVVLFVNPKPAGAVAAATPATVCPGSTVNLTSSASAGYTMNPAGTEAFIDIDAAASTTSITTLSDDSEHNIFIPSFTFNGVTYTRARVGMNGGIALGATTGDIAATNAALPTTSNTAGNILLLPWWDDLDIQSSPATTIKVDTVGTKFIIQYTNVIHNDISTSTIKFQVQLDTASGYIHFVYDDVDFGNASYSSAATGTVGIQMSSTNALQYSFNTPLLTNGQCITFAPAALSYSWTGPNGFTSSLQNPTLSNVSPADSGLYQVVFTNVATGCTDTVRIAVNVIPPGSSEWIGAVDSDWNNAGNWFCGTVPTITSNVVIRTGVPNYPVINQNVEIKSLMLRTGATITVNTGFDLKLNGSN